MGTTPRSASRGAASLLRGRRRRLRWLLLPAALMTAAAGPVTLVRVLGTDRTTPFAQLVAFSPFAGLIGALGLACALLARHRLLSLLLAMVTALQMLWIAPAWLADRPSTRGGTAVTVASLNAEFGAADAASVRRMVDGHDVDVLVLTELTPAMVRRLTAVGLPRVLPYRSLDPRDGPGGSGIFSRRPLRPLPAVPLTTFAMPRAVSSIGPQGLRVTAVHTFPPMPGSTRLWVADLAALRAVQVAGGPQVVAGDFNATRDHSAFRAVLATGLLDSADAARGGWAPTWPADRQVPAFLTLDHVLVSRQVAVRSTERVRVPGTDHLALVARLTIPFAG